MDSRELSTQLETLIDQHGIDTILNIMSEICHDKAEHIRSNWQDTPMAKLWEHDGNVLSKAVGRLKA